jgi:hypothetical protein
MRRKTEGQKSMDLEQAVALTDDEVATKNTRIRTLLREIKGLKAEVKQATSRNRKRIAECDAEIDHEMELIDQGIELRKQGSLFAKEDAQRGLHDIAAAAGEKKPTDPHAFEAAKGKPYECMTCGSGMADPVHTWPGSDAYEFDASEPAPGVIRTHAAVDLGDGKRRKVLNRKQRRGRGKEARA